MIKNNNIRARELG